MKTRFFREGQIPHEPHHDLADRIIAKQQIPNLPGEFRRNLTGVEGGAKLGQALGNKHGLEHSRIGLEPALQHLHFDGLSDGITS